MNPEHSSRGDTDLSVVVSKYFSHNPVMDESSSSTKKTKPSTSKNNKTKAEKVQKKPTKRIKGQKDIRTLIKPKKNELVTYSKEFDTICKQIGVDVDPEQLQLAIALSKSLQDSEAAHNIGALKDKALTANQRKGRIRTTLREYGFKVPEITKKAKKIKNYRKQYQLLLVSDTEKQARIADKYSQILFRNVSLSCNLSEDSYNSEKYDSFLYYIATNVSYNTIKSDDIFYVNNLVEKSFSEKHHMLKDWSEIPGRPKSPVQEVADIFFKSIQCSQEELADILSGTIKTTHNIVKKKFEDLSVNFINTKDSENCIRNKETQVQIFKFGGSAQISAHIEIEENVCINKNLTESIKYPTEHLSKETLKMAPPTYRSCSPDIFDDEVTIIMDNSTNVTNVQENTSDKTMVRDQIDFMDLTECVNVVNCNISNPTQYPCLSQGSNKTKMNPNDFMELTGCVTACSQRIINEIQPNFTLMNNKYSDTETTDPTNYIIRNSSPKTNNEYDNKSADDTIIVIDEEYCNPIQIKGTDIIDLVEDLNTTENSNTSDSPKHGYNVKSRDTDIIDDPKASPKDCLNFKENCKTVDQNDLPESDKQHLDSMDLTQSSDSNDVLSFAHTQESDSNSVEISSINKAEDNITGGEDQADTPDYANDTVERPNNYNEYNSVQSSTEKLPEEHNRYEAINLTQSSSEDSLNLTQKNNECKNLECSVVLNDNDDPAFDIPENDIGEDNKIKKIYLENVSPKNAESEQSIHDKLELSYDGYLDKNKKYKAVLNVDIDQEFDDIIKNVSKSKHSTASNSYSNHEVDLSNNVSVAYEKHSIFENDPDIQTNEFNSSQHSVQEPYDNSIHKVDSDEENCEIDLTQKSDRSEDKICSSEIMQVPFQLGLLGKRNDMSIDYDEEYNHEDDIQGDIINIGTSCDSFVQIDQNRSKDNAISGSSQNSEVFNISDDEFNYSIKDQKEYNSVRLDRTRFDIGISGVDELLNHNSMSITKLRCSCSNSGPSNENDNCQPEVIFTENQTLGDNVRRKSKSCTDVESNKILTPFKSRSFENIMLAQTPKHNDYIIETDVTPMPNYETMTSPERNEELDRFGIKPLKRKRAIQILTHIYNQTHPVMEVVSELENYSSPSKIRRRNDHTSFPKRDIVNEIDLVAANNYVTPTSLQLEPSTYKPSKSCEISEERREKARSPINKENMLYEETKQLPDIKNIECSSEDWVFQKREKAKVHSCRVPLHIAFHNYVSCRRALREAILRYEPINIDDIHKGLVAVGYRYNPKDLLKFMDKKCITVKTADNARNNKK